MDDSERIKHWQDTKDPQTFNELTIRFRPIVNSVVNKFKTVGVSPATLRAQATSQMIKAFKTYDPTKGTQPTTHVWNSLQKVHRTAIESQLSGHIPENRNLKRSTFVTVKENLTDRLGYEPSTDEMADELSWAPQEVSRMQNELGGETTASNAEFNFYGNDKSQMHPDIALVHYLYAESDPTDKLVLEHTFGIGGKKILSSKALASKLNVNEMYVRRSKDRMAKKIQEYK